MLGIAAANRQSGSLAKVPTMREQGIDAPSISNWRGIFGAKGITPAQVGYWETALSRVVVTDEWRQQLEHHNLESRFMRSRDFAAWLETEYAGTKAVMADLGLLK